MRLMLALSVLFLACVAEAQTGGKSPTAGDSDLKSTEQQWVDAYYRGDGKTLARIEADDFTVIASGQKPQTKMEQIAEVEGTCPAGVPSPERGHGDAQPLRELRLGEEGVVDLDWGACECRGGWI